MEQVKGRGERQKDETMSDRDKTQHDVQDWPPMGSAAALLDGTQRYGSTGQLLEVKNGQWVRVTIDAEERGGET
jgi:hypothetical protein